MTFGTDTDYFLPSEREPKNFQKLSREDLELIEMVRTQVSGSDDSVQMREAVSHLNEAFLVEELLGKTALITSDFTTVVSRGINYMTPKLEPTRVLEMVTSERQEGVFVGFDAIPLNGVTPELVYVIELPMVIEGLRFRTAVAAVDDAELMVQVEVSGVGQSLELLDQVNNPIVIRNLTLMGDLKDSMEEVDSDYLRELGLLATEILAQPEIADNKWMRDAVAELFIEFVEKEEWYAFKGFSADVIEEEGSIELSIEEIEAVGQVHAITTINDFEYISEEDGHEASVVVSKTYQPAFVFTQNDKVYVVPIRYLTLFYIDEFSPTTMRCESVRERFLEEYPDIFDPKKSKKNKIAKDSIKKYFQNDEGGV